MYGLDMAFSIVFDLDEDIIQIYNDKDIKLFCRNFFDIVLEDCRSISQPKRHYLILKMIVFGPKSCFPFIFFANFHPVIVIYEVKLSKLPCLP